MNLPAVLFALLLAAGIGAAYHLLRGGPLPRLLLYLLGSLVGFATGHYVGDWLQWSLVRLGSINLFSAALGAVLALVLADVLAPPPSSQERDPMGHRPPSVGPKA